MLLAKIEVVLIKPRFPENIGMVARACANMGCPNLTIVNPENWNLENALKTATSKGEEILLTARKVPDFIAAIEQSSEVWGTTARIGGWRKKIYNLETAALKIAEKLSENSKIALAFGNEKSGLSNQDISLCSKILSIPTYGSLSSLNIAQAVLLVLYECARMVKKLQDKNYGKIKTIPASLSIREKLLLEGKLKKILNKLDCVQGMNPDYHFLQWHTMIERMDLRRHEFDAWMGLCRQIENILAKNEKG